MSDYSALNISAAGLSMERLRLDIASMNIANLNTASRIGEGYIPKQLAANIHQLKQFDSLLNYQTIENFISIELGQVKSVFEPAHPLANSQGYVEYPDLNPLTETMNLMSATRSYEANTKAFNASKIMLEETLKLGK